MSDENRVKRAGANAGILAREVFSRDILAKKLESVLLAAHKDFLTFRHD